MSTLAARWNATRFGQILIALLLIVPSIGYGDGYLTIGPSGSTEAQPNSDPWPPYIIAPSYETDLPYEDWCKGTKERKIQVYCRDEAGHLLSDCTIQLSLDTVPYSMDHDHNESGRPKGSFSQESAVTNADGFIEVDYEAPAVAAEIRVTATATHPTETILPDTFPIYVMHTSLAYLNPGPNSGFELDDDGVTQWHPHAHAAQWKWIDALVSLSNEYRQTFTGSAKLRVNDISLPEGGILDICTDPAYQSDHTVCEQGAGSIWHKPHASHNCGLDGDVGLVPRDQRPQFEQMIYNNGFAYIKKHSDHWHLRRYNL